MIQSMHPHCECADPAPAESAAKPLHSLGDFVAVEESTIQSLHFATKTTAEPLRSVADSDAAADAPTETSYS
jgi:hypothetical protein